MFHDFKFTRKWWTGWSVFFILSILFLPASALAEAPIKVGIIGPMKFIYGQQTWWGASIAAEEINAAGGVKVKGAARQIELVQSDDNCLQSVVDAASAMERLITVDKVDFVIGGVRSEAVIAQQEVMADHKKIYMSSGVGSPEATARVAKNYDRYKYFFRSGFSGRWTSHLGLINVEMAGRRLKEKLGVEKPRVAVFAEKILVWEPLIKAVPGILEKMGMEYAGVWQPSAMATDVRAELEAMESADVHIIYQMFSGPVGIAASRQWGELKIPAVPCGVNVEAGRWKHWADTDGLCEYQMFGSPYPPVAVTEKTLPFVNKFFERYKDMPMWVAQSYDALYLLKEAIERVDTLDSDKVVEGLEKTDYVGAQGRMVFTPVDDPNPHEFLWRPDYLTWAAAQWQDGKWTVVWPDGNAAMGDKRFIGIKYPGTGEYQIPPWVVEYWQKKSK